MSQENVELMREAIGAGTRGDFEAAFGGMDPVIRFEHRLAALQGNFVGIADVKGWFADLIEVFESWRIDCEDIRDLGERVLALGTIHTIGGESGVETELPLAIVAEYRNGLITAYTDYGDRADALEAAGLSE